MRYIAPAKVLTHVDRLAAWKRGEHPAPVTIEWDLSSRCYLGCQSCHQAHTHTRGPWVTRDRRLPMAFEGVGDLADPALVRTTLTEVAALGVRGVVWTGGGEPTTHPQWTDLVAHAASCGLQQGMYTAGGLLTRADAHHLAAHASWVVVSLDAPDGATYAREKGVPPLHFEAACRGIDWLSEGSAVIGVSYLLHAQNWPRVREMLTLARSLGADYTTFRPTIEDAPDQSVSRIDRSWITEAMPLLEQVAQEPDVECHPARFAAYRDWAGRAYHTCHAIKLNTTITPDGRVWVCPQRRGMAQSSVGDLRTESFAEVWARHPGQWTDFAACRVMCRLHLDNEQLEPVFQSYAHEAFV